MRELRWVPKVMMTQRPRLVVLVTALCEDWGWAEEKEKSSTPRQLSLFE